MRLPVGNNGGSCPTERLIDALCRRGRGAVYLMNWYICIRVGHCRQQLLQQRIIPLFGSGSQCGFDMMVARVDRRVMCLHQTE